MYFLGSLAQRSQESNKSETQVKSPSLVTQNNHVAFGEFSRITAIQPRKTCVPIRTLTTDGTTEWQRVSFPLYPSQQQM